MPYTISEIDITQDLPSILVPEGDDGIAFIIRRNGRPIAFFMKALPAQTNLTPYDIGRLLCDHIHPQTLQQDDQPPPVSSLAPQPIPTLTVAICTKDNPKDLANSLNRLLALRGAEEEPGFQILVVDNAPSNSQTQEIVTSLPDVNYVMEPKPGLNFARNLAVQKATGDILAFIDDDVIVDRFWLRGLQRSLTNHPDAAAFTGLVLPTELKTEAQISFEAIGGFEKAYETIRYGQSLPGHPFYPCIGGKFGTGCNMAFRRSVLVELGGFDEALDTGAALPGGGDTDMLYRVVRAGYPLIYEPEFMVFHRHRSEYEHLRRQLCRSWSQGLMAFVFKSYRKDIPQRRNLRRLVRWWFGYQLNQLYLGFTGKHVLPTAILAAQLWGGIVGLLVAYPRSVRRIKHIRKHYS